VFLSPSSVRVHGTQEAGNVYTPTSTATFAPEFSAGCGFQIFECVKAGVTNYWTGQSTGLRKDVYFEVHTIKTVVLNKLECLNHTPFCVPGTQMCVRYKNGCVVQVCNLFNTKVCAQHTIFLQCGTSHTVYKRVSYSHYLVGYLYGKVT
jgi:hypothetical protein